MKSFYASVECVERGLHPLKTSLCVMSRAENANGSILASSLYLSMFLASQMLVDLMIYLLIFILVSFIIIMPKNRDFQRIEILLIL